ncbi:MAG: hypothetical protein K6F95_10065 [Selenomonas sp.]|uniref:hypothetical protein n=1 Tax=Selenomonas sp. TaxID=2053611 RepID=UPI0025D0D4E1|nr:hypothetical protein [Selenomonas sp.]MCR5758233.1 hypothetical protein [Selenomonas sp.]
MENWITLIIPGFFFLMGLLFFSLSVILHKKHLQKFAQYSAETKAVLTEWHHHTSSYRAGVTGWNPVFAYDVGQEHYEREEPIVYPCKGEEGIEVVLHYLPGKPYKFYSNQAIYLRQTRIFKLAGYVGMGLALLLFALLNIAL